MIFNIFKSIIILICLLFFKNNFGYGQDSIKKDGYTKLYYPNGKISSEGTLKNGKPDGYWKTYYVTGIVKSEGDRKSFLLDSIWIFYSQTGDTLEKINFFLGKKNGYYFTYYTNNEISRSKSNLASKELYVNDKKEGLAYYYYEDGSLKQTINYRNGKMEGISYEYDDKGFVITIMNYHNNYLTEIEKVNRKDKLNQKQGRWVEYYKTGKLKFENYYFNDQLNGLSKEYDEKGVLTQALRYDVGKIVQKDTDEDVTANIRNEYYPDGKLKSSGTFKKGIPIGIYREYNENSEVIASKLYNDLGELIGEGIINDKGERLGKWKNYYENGNVKSTGDYKNNLQTGKWTFFDPMSRVIQVGFFVKGKFDGTWTWYYENGKSLREENYLSGNLDGLSVEYDTTGNIIEKGNYIENDKDGAWYHNVGDVREEGEYKVGLREGQWKAYYPNGRVSYIGNFVQGNPEGMHKLYYENGKLKEIRNYVMGVKDGTWSKYSETGEIIMTITYSSDKEFRINGFKVATD